MEASNTEGSPLQNVLVLLKEYSEYSTIAGLVYLTQPRETRCGQITWISVLCMSLTLSVYWSAYLYNGERAFIISHFFFGLNIIVYYLKSIRQTKKCLQLIFKNCINYYNIPAINKLLVSLSAFIVS
jgi:hypothetical protein